MDGPARGMLFGMLDGLGRGWDTGVTKQQVAEGVGVIAATGIGFYQGYHGSAPSSGSWHLDGYAWDNAPNSVRVGYIGGWVGGIGVRIYKSFRDDNGSKKKKRGDRE